MTSFLQPVWSAIEKYIDSGISVIPVRDKDEGMKPAKSPYGSWKRFQSEIISKDELFELKNCINTGIILHININYLEVAGYLAANDSNGCGIVPAIH